jgi:outer membrane biosynthesis protein TonB
VRIGFVGEAVRQVALTSGHPLLAPAALEAVRQWVYQPVLLNEKPVEAITDIDVNFTLAE